MAKGEKPEYKKLDFNLLGRIIGLASPYKVLFIGTITLAVILAPVSMLRPFLVSVMIDDYIIANDLEGLYQMSFIFIALVVATVILRYLLIYQSSLLGQSVIRDIRRDVFNHITSLKLKYFDQTPIGKATTRTINDIETINTVFTQGIVTMIADVLGIFAVLGIMFFTSWRLTLLVLVTLPLLIIATYIFKEKVKVTFQKVRKELAELNAFLQERISGMSTIQIFNAEKQEMDKFKKINRKYTQANIDAVNYYAIFFPTVEFINYLALAILVYLGARFVIGDMVSLGTLLAFPWYINLLFRPVRFLADKFNTLQMGMVAAERVFNVLDNNMVIPNYGSHHPKSVKGAIAFDKVCFSYDGENEVIKNLSFEVQSGETLAIIGSTGSGKTTIINLLSRFYEVSKGSIKIDGVDIKSFELSALRSRMAIVLQDVFLFYGTVFENITLKDERISHEEVIEASKTIGAHRFIMELQEGYDSMIMERGANLSMGQRQLISFVRALVFKPDILVLDEATSSIDTETEEVIQYAIEKLIDKRTSIIIAHRLSTIRNADNILVMEHGKLAEFGKHDDLVLQDNGRYRELYEMQFSSDHLSLID